MLTETKQVISGCVCIGEGGGVGWGYIKISCPEPVHCGEEGKNQESVGVSKTKIQW